MEAFLAALKIAAAALPALEPILAKTAPDLESIAKVAELLAKAGGDVAPQVALVLQILGGKPLTAAQRADRDATYDRLYANVQRDRPLPPGSV